MPTKSVLDIACHKPLHECHGICKGWEHLATLVEYGGTHAGSANSGGVRLISEMMLLVF